MADRRITRDILLTAPPGSPEYPDILEELGVIQDDDDLPSNESGNTPFAQIAEERVTRRGVLAGLGAVAAFGLVSHSMISRRALAAGVKSSSRN